MTNAREVSLDLDLLGVQPCDLQDMMEDIFTEEEVWNTIKELPFNCARGRAGL